VALRAMPPIYWFLLCLRIIDIYPGFLYGHQTGRKSFRSQRNNYKFAQTTDTANVSNPLSGFSGPTMRRASSSPKLHEWWTQPAHVGCPVAQLSIWRKSGDLPSSSTIWSITLMLPQVCVIRDQAQHRWKNHRVWIGQTGFLTVAYGGACSTHICVRMAWISFGTLPCRKKNLMKSRISMFF
jgi:hypothetical protein